MVKFTLAKEEDINKISNFIAKLNRKEESHIAYCGDDSEEIENSLKEDITDIQFDKSFVIATEENEIVGVLGFDADMERNNAEIWGPFIEKGKWSIATDMWDKMLQLIPKGIVTTSMFVNNKNYNCLGLADILGFSKNSEEIILEFKKSDLNNLDEVCLIELAVEDFEAMKELHDKTFPNTYYSGEEIISRLNNHRKVFVCKEAKELTGYIYVEAEPEFGEGNIEFFAVNESQRGKGIGCYLLTMALRWLFSFNSIDSISLCVNSKNEKAINLYKMAGFKEKHQLSYFIKRE
ncbi:GNAT family N-acetyltransferase [uncultured Tissierella sp.]|uniref:GNAT family N-acetyltransferase n=1 Tax=uncultured Tissierella sp. TaxID=448160 RepID=UPI002804D7A5|nr:GNAT family N-acetyltransferase [uncultured Tissierella sp.]MDU5080797.1 GNAT family N-acetyltransferase [Bacillota bacterium]